MNKKENFFNIDEEIYLIEGNLNNRFYKNEEKYISKDIKLKIKESLKNNKFENLNLFWKEATGKSMFSLSSEMLTMEIIENSWVINKKIDIEDLKFLRSIFQSCDKTVYTQKVNEVLLGKYMIPKELLNELKRIYINNLELCELKNLINLNKDHFRENRFRDIIIRNIFVKDNNPQELVNFIDMNINIIKVKEDECLNILRQKSEGFKQIFNSIIFEKKIKNRENIDYIWIDLFILDYFNKDFDFKYLNKVLVHLDETLIKRIACSIVKFEMKNDSQEYKNLNNLLCKDILIEYERIKKESQRISTFNEFYKRLMNCEKSLWKEDSFLLIYESIERESRLFFISNLKDDLNLQIVKEFYLTLLMKEDKRLESEILRTILNFLKFRKDQYLKKDFIKVLKLRRFNYRAIKDFLSKNDFDLYIEIY